MPFFRPPEFKCPCEYNCGMGFQDINHNSYQRLLNARQMAEQIANQPEFSTYHAYFKITSSIRCHKHNRDVGGTEFSAHLDGKAFDIVTRNSKHRYVILRSLIGAGFNRIGIYPGFIHADDDETKPLGVVWYG